MDERLRFVPLFLGYYCFSLVLISIIALFSSDAHLLLMELGVTLIISVSMALIFMEHEFKVVAIRKLPLIPLSYNVVIHCVDWSEYSVNRDGLSYDDALLLYQRIHDDLADSSLVLVELCYDGDCSPNYRTFVKSNIMHVSVVEV